jgi:hypothetical protein
MLDCRDLPQLSYERSQKRLERATGVLGAKVVTRLLAFSLYLLGANRDALAGCLGIRLETLKSLVKRGFSDGLVALEDRRRSLSTFLPRQAPAAELRPKVSLEPETLVVEFDEGTRMRVPLRNRIQCRTVLLSMAGSKLLSVDEVADGLGLSAERVRKLKTKLAQDDVVAALVDQRSGQQRDYRVTPEVKAELIQQYVVNLQTEGRTSSEKLKDDLSNRCNIEIASRTIRLHVAKLGLPLIRDSLPQLLSEVKKTSGG